jgi:hypothetical protein
MFDLTGQTFNFWSVLGPAAKRANRAERYWLARCICGKHKNLSSYSLRKGGTQSCGCQKNTLIAKANRRHGQSPRYSKWSPEYALYVGAKARAKRRGILFELALDDIIIPAYCPVLNLKLEPNNKIAGAASPTIDRVDNTKGYTKDNIRVISFRANSLKADATPDELEKILAYIKSGD